MPRIKQGCDEEYAWENHEDWLKSKYTYVVYAETDAIVKAKCSVEGCTMYTLIHPGNESAKMIVESGIKEVIYYSNKGQDKKFRTAAETIFRRAGMEMHVKEYKTEDVNNEDKILELAKKTIYKNEVKRYEES